MIRIHHIALGSLVMLACGGTVVRGPDTVALPKVTPGDVEHVDVPLAPSEMDSPVPVLANDPAWGDRAAPVTIVEFDDFQCPFCARAAETIDQIEKNYGPQKLRVVFKNEPLPFHPNARPAAEAAATIHALGGNTAFWKFFELAYHDQADLGEASYEAWAQQSGVPVGAFRDAFQSHRFASKVDDDMDLAQKVGVNGTPAFYINGISLGGAQPPEKFKEIIDAELAASSARREKGVSALGNYVAASKENFHKAADNDDDDAPAPPDTTVWKVPIGTSPTLGPKTALVTIVEFSDFQCPYCKKVEPTLKRIRTAYGNDVRLVFKHEPLPFHPRAEPAAEVALEALAEKGQTGFWAAHDALFDSQPALDDADLDKVATDLKLDLAKVHAAITTHKYQHTLDDDADAADDFKASGTPHFFIDGRRLIGAQPFDKFKTMIDEELVKARALVAAGTKPENVYAELTKNGATPPPPEQKTVTFTTNAPLRGPANARVTVVEFSDFQCPYCKRAEDTIAEVLKAYPTQVHLEWRHLPLAFHTHAEVAAEASVEAFKQKGNDGFWKLHDALFAHQADPDGLERANIETYVTPLGIDAHKLHAALDAAQHASTVDADSKVASAASISGTPAFIIGVGTPRANVAWTGYSLSGAQPLAKFKKLIDKSLGGHP
jgi:protein-disulfide isomerase